MKKRTIVAFLLVCSFFLTFASPVSAAQPTDEDLELVYDFTNQELTVLVIQCRQVVCQISENYVSLIDVYKVAFPFNILMESRNITKTVQTWGMTAVFDVEATEGEQLLVQVTLNEMDDTPWPVLSKYITSTEITTPNLILTDLPTIPILPDQDPIETIILIGVIGGIILSVVVVSNRLLFKNL